MHNSQDNLSAFHRGQVLTEGLILVREDICDWINSLVNVPIISGDSFLSSLQTGILLCNLINRIYHHVSTSVLPKSWPTSGPIPDLKATAQSFKAKDNISLFLAWCRKIGMSNTILFETKGLTNYNEEKNIVLTLLHLGEICVDFDMPLPEFARFHKEMMVGKAMLHHTTSVYTLGDTSDLGSTGSESISARSESNIFDTVDSESSSSQAQELKILKKKPKKPLSADNRKIEKTLEILESTVGKEMTPANVPPVQTRPGKFVKNNMRLVKMGVDKSRQQKMIRSKSRDDICKFKSEDCLVKSSSCKNIDLKIKEITNKCRCQNKFTVERTTLQEGMYKIGSKNIFVRMFRGNIMLRVGGGWETLNEYMAKVDPCCKSDGLSGSVYQRRQSMVNTFTTDLTTEGLISKNLRKLSQSEITTVRKKVVASNYLKTPTKS